MQTKTAQLGFSFLELMIIFALLTLLGAFVVPNLFRTKQGAERKEFLTSFETLLKDATLRSIVENKMHQIYIDIAHELIQTRIYDSTSIEVNKHKQFVALEKNKEYLVEIPFLKRFKINNFFINGVDEVVPGAAMQDVVFYVMPDGTSQAVIANLIDQDEEAILPDVNFSFVINPFYARISVYETFQTP
ncbi:MAG: type II secretion system protein [Candidatus Dependentiae bacterium]|nr:type II secretion system protein [Candidatus Dependentiae bacterium]